MWAGNIGLDIEAYIASGVEQERWRCPRWVLGDDNSSVLRSWLSAEVGPRQIGAGQRWEPKELYNTYQVQSSTCMMAQSLQNKP